MITFNNVDLSTLEWITVNQISRPMSAPFSNSIKTNLGRDISYNFGFSLEPKIYKIDCTIEAMNGESVYDTYNKFLTIFYTKEEKEFILNDNPSVSYFGRLNSAPTQKKITNSVFEVSFEIVCSKPFGQGAEQNLISLGTGSRSLDINNSSYLNTDPLITITNKFSPPPVLNPNGGFEQNKTGWTFQNTGGANGVFTIDASTYYQGGKSGKLLKQSAVGTPRIYFTFSGYELGKDYYFTAYVKSTVADGVTVYAEEETVDWQYPQVSDTMTNQNVTGEWTKIKSKITPTTSDGTIYFFFEARAGEVYDFYVDEVRLIEAAEEVTGELNLIKVSLNNRTIDYQGTLRPEETLLLDSNSWTATVGGKNVLFNIDGAFPSIEPGGNILNFESNSVQSEVKITYREMIL